MAVIPKVDLDEEVAIEAEDSSFMASSDHTVKESTIAVASDSSRITVEQPDQESIASAMA